MAKKPAPKRRTPAKRKTPSKSAKPLPWWQRVRAWSRRGLRWLGWGVIGLAALTVLAVGLTSFINPPTTPYMWAEARRLGSVDQYWVRLEDISPDLVRSVIAAEDANFCLHWGFDMAELRKAIEEGGERGASTISQQVTKNVFLWHGRSWPRKALEALMTPLVELFWSKRRIIEVYLNVSEFGAGVFGAEAAARTNFRVGPDELTASQAARLAAVLPAPKQRSAANPSSFVWKRAEAIMDGAATIRVDGRSDCVG